LDISSALMSMLLSCSWFDGLTTRLLGFARPELIAPRRCSGKTPQRVEGSKDELRALDQSRLHLRQLPRDAAVVHRASDSGHQTADDRGISPRVTHHGASRDLCKPLLDVGRPALAE